MLWHTSREGNPPTALAWLVGNRCWHCRAIRSVCLPRWDLVVPQIPYCAIVVGVVECAYIQQNLLWRKDLVHPSSPMAKS